MFTPQSTYRPRGKRRNADAPKAVREVARGVGKELKGLGRTARREAKSWFGF